MSKGTLERSSFFCTTIHTPPTAMLHVLFCTPFRYTHLLVANFFQKCLQLSFILGRVLPIFHFSSNYWGPLFADMKNFTKQMIFRREKCTERILIYSAMFNNSSPVSSSSSSSVVLPHSTQISNVKWMSRVRQGWCDLDKTRVLVTT